VQAQVDRRQSRESVAGLAAAERAQLSRAEITKWALICGAAAIVSSAVLSAVEPADGLEAPLFQLLGDNEIPNPVIDDLLELGGDVVAFLMRMVPG
jgi:hypothetical protein